MIPTIIDSSFESPPIILSLSESRSSSVVFHSVLRLVFHDCMRYTDGTGGCDGCLNWAGVGNPIPSPFRTEDFYAFTPPNNTDNNGLGDIVEKLELIYTTIDWPFQVYNSLVLYNSEV